MLILDGFGGMFPCSGSGYHLRPDHQTLQDQAPEYIVSRNLGCRLEYLISVPEWSFNIVEGLDRAAWAASTFVKETSVSALSVHRSPEIPTHHDYDLNDAHKSALMLRSPGWAMFAG